MGIEDLDGSAVAVEVVAVQPAEDLEGAGGAGCCAVAVFGVEGDGGAGLGHGVADLAFDEGGDDRAMKWQLSRASIRAGLCRFIGVTAWGPLRQWWRRSRWGW